MTLNKAALILAMLAQLVLIAPLSANGPRPAAFIAQTIHVKDGDSFTASSNGRNLEIRLASIDAPEYFQTYGRESKAHLEALIGSQRINVRPYENDRYGRVVGDVFIGNLNINREMVRTGNAWAYRRYLHDSSMIGLERAARSQKLGLWSGAQTKIKPPWLERKDKAQ